jgi:hypothetical protein
MKTLPNGLTIFNSTPHLIRFWDESWNEPVEVEPDAIINAKIEEHEAYQDTVDTRLAPVFDKAEFVQAWPVPVDDAEIVEQTIYDAYSAGADVVIGSILAAQAYKGLICAMVPCVGYERVSPTEKRMRPDKFTVF